MNDIVKLICSRRSIRRFQSRPIDESILIDCLEAARCAPSAANRQPLEFILVREADMCREVFASVAWAGLVKPARNPRPGEEPQAYIIVLVNRDIAGDKGSPADAGAAIQNIMLAAWSEGIGACWMGAIDRLDISQTLRIPENMSIDSLIAFGYPAEEPQMEDAEGRDTASVRYYLDAADRLHIPKRKLGDIVHAESFGNRTYKVR